MEYRTGLPVAAAILSLAFVLPSPAAAGELRADAPIVAVTVFPDRARVTRTVEIRLPAGSSTVVLGGLSAGLIGQSLRVEGSGSGAFLIGSVETRRRFLETAARAEERRLESEIEALGDGRREIEDRVAALRLQLDFIAAIGRDMPKSANEEIVRGKMAPGDWKTAWLTLAEGAAEARGGIRKAEIEARAIKRRIERARRELNRVRTGRKSVIEARINVEAGTPVSARLSLSYQIRGASWRPLYDARLDTAAERVSLTQIGEIRQRTGEDWSGVRLALSTARPGIGARVPALDPWFIDIVETMPIGGVSGAASALRKTDSFDELRDAMSRERMLASEAPAKQKKAEIVAAEFAATYRIAGVATVPSDGEPHKVVISERTLEAELAILTAPKLGPMAYLYGEVKHGGEEPLLPGPVAVFRDGAFVGGGALPLLRPGETAKLAFGADDKVRVDYRLETAVRSRQGLFDRDRRHERRYRIEIANHHARAMTITVLDQLPVARDERIEVVLLKDATQPSERDVDGRTGVLAWTHEYKPGETRIIRFAYAVSHPEDERVIGF